MGGVDLVFFLGGFMPFECDFFVVWGYFFTVFFGVSFNGFVTDSMLSYFAFCLFHICTSFFGMFLGLWVLLFKDVL